MTISGYEAIQRRFASLGQLDGRLLNMIANQIVREAKLKAPRKTSNLRRSIRSEAAGMNRRRIVAGAGYAAAVEFGTAPHSIEPRVKRALRFAFGGNARLTGTPRKGADAIFAMHVNHPGTRAQPFLEPAVKIGLAKANMSAQVFAAWNVK